MCKAIIGVNMWAKVIHLSDILQLSIAKFQLFGGLMRSRLIRLRSSQCNRRAETSEQLYRHHNKFFETLQQLHRYWEERITSSQPRHKSPCEHQATRQLLCNILFIPHFTVIGGSFMSCKLLSFFINDLSKVIKIMLGTLASLI